MTTDPTIDPTTALARRAAAAPIAWEQELRGAQLLLRSGLAPASLRTPEAVLYVILAGRDLGLSPVQSLRSLHVIQGRVEVSADLQLALWRRAGGRATWETLTDTAAVLRLTHPCGDTHTESWTIEDARRAGLDGATWRRYPRAMLRSRAITAGLKSIGYDCYAGLCALGELEAAPGELEAVAVADGGATAETVPPPIAAGAGGAATDESPATESQRVLAEAVPRRAERGGGVTGRRSPGRALARRTRARLREVACASIVAPPPGSIGSSARISR